MNASLCKAIFKYMEQDPSGMKNFIIDLKYLSSKCFDYIEAGIIFSNNLLFFSLKKPQEKFCQKHISVIQYLNSLDINVARELYFKIDDYYYFVNYLYEKLISKEKDKNKDYFNTVMNVLEDVEIDYLEILPNLEKKYSVGIITPKSGIKSIYNKIKSDGTQTIIVKGKESQVVKYIEPNYILKIKQSENKTEKRIFVKSLELPMYSLKRLKEDK